MQMQIKMLRQKQNMTQADLAEKMSVTQSVIAMWERGASMPASAKLPRLADVLQCSIDELYGRDTA